MTQVSAAIQVQSFHPGTFGGGALLGRDASSENSRVIRALIPPVVLSREPLEGEIWRVVGSTSVRPVFDQRLRREVDAEHIIATWAGPVAPRGAAIRHWIAKNPLIKGVGEGYAERLWDAYGPTLYRLLRERDLAAIAKVLDFPKAAAIVDAFGLLTDEITALEELDTFGLDGRTARTALTLFGAEAGRKFQENPYLLTLLEPWAKTDAAALLSGLHSDDERRLLAAVDVAAGSAWRIARNTVVARATLVTRVRTLLGGSASEFASAAVELAISRGELREVAGRRLQARAPWCMERGTEASVAERLTGPKPAMDQATIDVVIGEVERENQIYFEPEQREAVHMALSTKIALITGGAGTGKSTIVKAIMRAADRGQRGAYVQVALSGRAAKRLREATGAPALTIYRYLKDLEHGRLKLQRGLLVIDECSMVSTPDLWLLLTSTPIEVDVLLVGDPAQLPPIQAGNPIAALAGSKSIPQVALRVPHRQNEGSGIAFVSEHIRHGRMPGLPTFDASQADREGVFIFPCADDEIEARTLEVFAAQISPADGHPRSLKTLHDADVQILSATKRVAEEIGAAIERRWMADQPAIHNWGFHVGSKILWTKNTYEHGDKQSGQVVDIMNGALGIIQRATAAGAEVLFDDDTKTEIRIANLDRVLRGWAITTHKAQGSAFQRVIIPVTKSKLLDRSMLYTAVTRARCSAVFVGDPELLARRIQAPPTSWHRDQALTFEHIGKSQAIS